MSTFSPARTKSGVHYPVFLRLYNGDRFAKLCFQIALRAKLCFPSRALKGRDPNEKGHFMLYVTQFTANLWFQFCKPMGKVTRAKWQRYASNSGTFHETAKV